MARTLDYTYDSFNRLKKVSDNTTETVYTYDANGLRLSKTSNGTTEQYVYDGDKLVLKLVVGPIPVLSKTLTSTSMGWDIGDNPLTPGQLYYVEVNGVVYTDRATKEGEPFSAYADFAYDNEGGDQPEIPPGSELWPTILSAGGVSIRITPYSPDEDYHYVELSGPAGATVKVYNTDPRKVVTTAYIRGLGLIASRANEVVTYYHYDAHGNVVQLTGAIGTVLKDYTYDAFGVEQGADDTDANIFRYCGEQYDTETGNYYLRARYYTPGAGRFTQEDPAMDGINWYAYCAGNPVAFVDPSGFYTKDTELILEDIQTRINNGGDAEYYQSLMREVKSYDDAGTPFMYGQEKMKEIMHKNANEIISRLQAMYKDMQTNPFMRNQIWGIFFSYVRLTETTWDYKRKPEWQVPYDMFLDRTDGLYHDMDETRIIPGEWHGNYQTQPKEESLNRRNWTPWIYFEGEIIGADKFGNLNLAYVGARAGFPEWSYSNFATRDKDDTRFIDWEINLARSGW